MDITRTVEKVFINGRKMYEITQAFDGIQAVTVSAEEKGLVFEQACKSGVEYIQKSFDDKITK